MMVYDDTGNLIRSIKLDSKEEEIKIPGGAMIKMKIERSRSLLVKSSDEEGIYYEPSDHRQSKAISE